MRTDILKAGFLVSLGTTLEGGVTYDRVDLPAPDSENGEEIKRWDTTRIRKDAEEHERAVKSRSLATNAVKRVCARIGAQGALLCPIEREEELDAAISEAQSIADDFNASATHTRISVSIYKGRMAEGDEQNTRSIADEIKTLLSAMESGVLRLDAGAIRDASSRARQVGQMLGADDAERVGSAISAARTAARAIVKRIEKGGEEASDVLADLQTRPIEVARFAFLDNEEQARFASLENEGGVEARLPSIDRQRFADIDTTDAISVTTPRSAARRELD